MVVDNLIIILLAIAGALVVGYLIGHAIGTFRRERAWRTALPEHRADAIARSRAVLTGQFSEQIAPYLPGFLYSPTECKFIGKPVDFVVFNGLDDKNVKEIVFVEVKSGKSRLSGTENSVKDAVLNGKVKWAEYRAPD
ncbi:MAG: Holliday junction resolvase-like protein [Nanoarchaeota archaeon]